MVSYLSRRDALRAAASLPLMLAARTAGAAGEDPALAFATARAERLAAPLQTLRGRVPPGLAGTLWRNGPAEHDRFGHRYGHWFDGDGMIQAFRFDGSGVTHRARILDTPKRRRETEAGRRLLPAFGSMPPDPTSFRGPDDMNPANTSMIVHAGRHMALWEGGSALAFDPATLNAGSFVMWSKDIAGAPFSAHPKVEADGTMWNIGYLPMPRPALVFYRVDPQGRLAKVALLAMAPLGLTHDFVVTARRLIMLLTPFVLDTDRFASGNMPFLDAHVWRPELGVRVLVVDKDSLEVERHHNLPPGFHFHHGNGWEEPDGTIRLDLCQAPDPSFVIREFRNVMQGDIRFRSAHPVYRQVVLRPDGSAAYEHGDEVPADFPRIDPRRLGHRHSMTFALAGVDGALGWPLQRVVRFTPSEVDGWTWPSHRIPEEHVFVPRGASEGEGWLLGPFLDLSRRTSGLAVFEAGRLEDGPVWEGILPYPLPLGLHGTFAAA
ncbi:MAG: carotenoid oxygenase family protein [Alphaproteobacteria bacterium]|nr:carotenoid oxygenase family protein [Alphaproteobacteria bacterium]